MPRKSVGFTFGFHAHILRSRNKQADARRIQQLFSQKRADQRDTFSTMADFARSGGRNFSILRTRCTISSMSPVLAKKPDVPSACDSSRSAGTNEPERKRKGMAHNGSVARSQARKSFPVSPDARFMSEMIKSGTG